MHGGSSFGMVGEFDDKIPDRTPAAQRRVSPYRERVSLRKLPLGSRGVLRRVLWLLVFSRVRAAKAGTASPRVVDRAGPANRAGRSLACLSGRALAERRGRRVPGWRDFSDAY